MYMARIDIGWNSSNYPSRSRKESKAQGLRTQGKTGTTMMTLGTNMTIPTTSITMPLMRPENGGTSESNALARHISRLPAAGVT